MQELARCCTLCVFVSTDRGRSRVSPNSRMLPLLPPRDWYNKRLCLRSSESRSLGFHYSLPLSYGKSSHLYTVYTELANLHNILVILQFSYFLSVLVCARTCVSVETDSLQSHISNNELCGDWRGPFSGMVKTILQLHPKGLGQAWQTIWRTLNDLLVWFLNCFQHKDRTSSWAYTVCLPGVYQENSDNCSHHKIIRFPCPWIIKISLQTKMKQINPNNLVTSHLGFLTSWQVLSPVWN